MTDTTGLRAGFMASKRGEAAARPLRRHSDRERWKVGFRRLRTLLCLSASPVFGALAAINAALPGMDLCLSPGGTSFLGGMTTMYAVMCVIHLEAWLKRLAAHRK